MLSVHRQGDNQKGSSVGWETNEKASSNTSACNLTGCSGKDFLTTMTNGNQTAFSGTFCTEGVAVYLLFELAGQVITQGGFGKYILVIFTGKSRISVRDLYTDMGGRGKGISLDMVNGKNEIFKAVSAL